MRMTSLPTEVKIDILKFFNFEELFLIKQSNRYFNDFIDKYEGEFARMELSRISIVDIDNFNSNVDYKLIKPEVRNFDLPLDGEWVDERLEEKWKTALVEPIPLFLHDCESKNHAIFMSKEVEEYYRLLHLPNYITNIDEMKIVRHYLNKIFNYSFKEASFKLVIFNQLLIELLFENVKIPIQFYVKEYWIMPKNNNIANLLKFIWNYLISKSLTIDFLHIIDAEKYIDILFKILMNGNRFSEICFNFLGLPGIFDLVINHIETSNDCSKIVANIKFIDGYLPFKLSKRAVNVEENPDHMNYYHFIKFQLSNQHNPKIKFSILYTKFHESIKDIEIKRIK
ncbi:hypothetical protein ACQ4LE_005761 [Meloidogyne hapla]|uniref:F-box domain-containing protein n=1 Tax=Meloidogyne hapla TaxID=6305 RepID=A0A1I8B280_MELHA